MFTPNLHRALTANDKAEILALIDARSRRRNESASLELQSRDLTIWTSSDAAFSEGLVRWSGPQKGQEDASPFWTRETICFERRPEGWRVVHEQTSAPFSMDRGANENGIATSRLKIGWASAELPASPCS